MKTKSLSVRIAALGVVVFLVSSEHAAAHFFPWPHEHGVGTVHGSFEHDEGQGVVAQGCNSGSQAGTISYSEGHSVSNGVQTGVGIDAKLVRAQVGVDVKWSSFVTAGYQQPVYPGTCAQIRLYYKYRMIPFQNWLRVYGLGYFSEIAVAGEFLHVWFLGTESPM